MKTVILAALFAGLLSIPLFAQPKTGVRPTGERVILVVPVTGTGTYSDPRRPALTPTAAEIGDKSKGLHFSWVASDDGRLAIVDLSARSMSVLARFRTDSRASSVFERGKHKREDVERELQKLRKDYKVNGSEGKKQ